MADLLNIIPRRPLDSEVPDAYKESDLDFLENNLDTAVEMLENPVYRAAPAMLEALEEVKKAWHTPSYGDTNVLIDHVGDAIMSVDKALALAKPAPTAGKVATYDLSDLRTLWEAGNNCNGKTTWRISILDYHVQLWWDTGEDAWCFTGDTGREHRHTIGGAKTAVEDMLRARVSARLRQSANLLAQFPTWKGTVNG